MNAITKAYHRAVVAVKNAALRWGGGAQSWWNARLGSTTLNYAAEVGDGSGNAAVQACLKWMARTFMEAPPRIRRYAADDKLTPETRHELLLLLRRPNPHYTGRALWKATINDRKIDGNAYWYKLRSRAGVVLELWWLPT
jgi:phage portal protein BeeE